MSTAISSLPISDMMPPAKQKTAVVTPMRLRTSSAADGTAEGQLGGADSCRLLDRSGSKAPVRSGAGNGCSPS